MAVGGTKRCTLRYNECVLQFCERWPMRWTRWWVLRSRGPAMFGQARLKCMKRVGHQPVGSVNWGGIIILRLMCTFLDGC